MTLPAALKYVRPLLAVLVAAGLAAGFAAKLAGFGNWSGVIWAAVTVPVLLALVTEIASSLWRGDVGLDIVAALSMTAALLVGEELAAAIVALMYAGGQYLKAYAERQARREMTAPLSRVPRTAVRHRDSRLEEVVLDLVLAGDRLLIRRDDVVPVDGTVVGGVAALDQSALTSEAMPVTFTTGGQVLSGSTNVGDAFDLMATRRAAESTYAGVVRLVEAAQRSCAPMSRLADRYAILFLGVTAAMAAAAWWLTSDPIRAVAVLVVATPCPLILAVPVAIVAGLSRAAKLGILIKGGKAIETLARVRALVIDKTGTLTIGHARIVDVQVVDGMTADELLTIAASLDQASKHIIAQTIVAEARGKGLALTVPTEVVETPGEGIVGRIESRRVMVGGLHFIAGQLAGSAGALLGRERTPGALTAAAVAVDGKLAGLLILSDGLRAGTEQLLRALRALGIERIVLATGDPPRGGPVLQRRAVPGHGALGPHARPESAGGAVGAIAAALGFIVPVEGALLQEVIDVAVIFNALRALRG